MLTPKEIIFRLKPCTWRYNDVLPNLGDKLHYGFIAQDLVREFGDDYGFVDQSGEFMRVHYTEFIAPAIAVIQEQEDRIKQLEKQIGELYEYIDLRTRGS